MSRFRVLSCVVAPLIFSAGSANSQTTFASITGTVLDSTGAVVPNATVTSTNLATNIKNTAKSNESGTYTIAQWIREAGNVAEVRARARALGITHIFVRHDRLLDYARSAVVDDAKPRALNLERLEILRELRTRRCPRLAVVA